MRIGIFGGTFDPPHTGHIQIARAAKEQLELDELIIVPAHNNPLKANRPKATSRQRLEMVRLAIGNELDIMVSDIEIVRGGKSYMIDTITELQHAIPGEYWLVLGADSLKSFESWKDWQKILTKCRLGAVVRPPDTWASLLMRLTPEMREKTDKVEIAPTEASSTEIRNRFAKGEKSIPYMAPKVLEYIRQNHLYENK